MQIPQAFIMTVPQPQSGPVRCSESGAHDGGEPATAGECCGQGEPSEFSQVLSATAQENGSQPSLEATTQPRVSSENSAVQKDGIHEKDVLLNPALVHSLLVSLLGLQALSATRASQSASAMAVEAPVGADAAIAGTSRAEQGTASKHASPATRIGSLRVSSLDKSVAGANAQMPGQKQERELPSDDQQLTLTASEASRRGDDRMLMLTATEAGRRVEQQAVASVAQILPPSAAEFAFQENPQISPALATQAGGKPSLLGTQRLTGFAALNSDNEAGSRQERSLSSSAVSGLERSIGFKDRASQAAAGRNAGESETEADPRATPKVAGSDRAFAALTQSAEAKSGKSDPSDARSAAQQADKAPAPTAQASSEAPLATVLAHGRLTRVPDSLAAEATAAPSAATQIGSPPVIDQIVQRALIQLKDGPAEMRIDLKPEALGHVQLSITSENQQIRVNILTEHAAVKELVEGGLAALKSALLDRGLQVERLDVGVFVAAEQNPDERRQRRFFNQNPTSRGTIAEEALAGTQELETITTAAAWRYGASRIGVFA